MITITAFLDFLLSKLRYIATRRISLRIVKKVTVDVYMELLYHV